MLSRAAEFARLSLMMERLQDAELLPDEEIGTLVREIEAAHKSLDAGDTVTAHVHTTLFVQIVEALAQNHYLAPTDAKRFRELLDAVPPFTSTLSLTENG